MRTSLIAAIILVSVNASAHLKFPFWKHEMACTSPTGKFSMFWNSDISQFANLILVNGKDETKEYRIFIEGESIHYFKIGVFSIKLDPNDNKDTIQKDVIIGNQDNNMTCTNNTTWHIIGN